MYSLPQKLAAEFVGAFALIFVGAGSICADQYLHVAGQPGLGPFAIAAAQGLAFGVMVTAVAHISGGHLNPAVTIGFWVTRRIGTFQALAYWIAQMLGATAAAFLLTVLIPEVTWRGAALGTPSVSPDITRLQGMAIEAALTFLLVFVVFATNVDVNGFNKIAGLAIGATVTMDILIGAPFTGAAINPVRAFGPALATRHWANHGVYWLGPLIGGLLAGFLYDRLFLRDEPPLEISHT